jgi:hypothetical protein
VDPQGLSIQRNDKDIHMKLRTTLALAAFAWTAVAAQAQLLAENPATPPPKPERQAPKVERNLKTFDTLDFDVFSNQKWDRLHESHARDIVVTWPDGHETRGIAIKTHPSATGRTARWTTSGCSGTTRTS